MTDEGGERLNRWLARAGVSSRRGADSLIEAGRVSVNGRVVTELGRKIDPASDEVRVDGNVIGAPGPLTYVALYKPRNVITTAADPAGRPTVTELVSLPGRLFPVGRLDGASEGLVLLTNDGDFAQQVGHPRFGHEREYRVKISGSPTETALRAWREGMFLDDGRTLPAGVIVESSTGAGTWLRMVLREGRNRQIRRMVEAFHHQVHRLIRIRMGAVRVGDLKPGEWRHLTADEVEALKSGRQATAQDQGTSGRRPKRYKPGWARPKPRPKRRGAGRGSKR